MPIVGLFAGGGALIRSLLPPDGPEIVAFGFCLLSLESLDDALAPP